MFFEVSKATYLGGYSIKLEFENGKSGVLDFYEYLQRGKVFHRFSDINYFQDFIIENGTLCWKNDVDIAPDTLYTKATGEIIPEDNVENKKSVSRIEY